MKHSSTDSATLAQQHAYTGLPQWADKLIAALSLIAITPLLVCNALIAIAKEERICTEVRKVDALGRNTVRLVFSCGVLKNSADLFQVLIGDLRLCGATCSYRLPPTPHGALNSVNLPGGLISLYDVRQHSGLAVASPETLYKEQSQMSAMEQLGLLVRFVFNCFLFRTVAQHSPALVPLFGLNINNTEMNKAIEWFCNGTFFRGIKRSSLNLKKPKISFFVNANSINLAQRNPQFKQTLQKADCLFADGSGMRLAAKSNGVKLVDNINGTDVLPLLCQAAQTQNKRLFLLGAKPDVANKAAINLTKQYPGLHICGTHHGFFSTEEEADIIQHINTTGTDILLVAQGSPLQESWVIKNAPQLTCESVMAVGGLFDFYSGDIARAPLWMRETGIEWVWRLLQEPVTKCKRYLVGVPEFMFRTFVLKQVGQE